MLSGGFAFHHGNACNDTAAAIYEFLDQMGWKGLIHHPIVKPYSFPHHQKY